MKYNIPKKDREYDSWNAKEMDRSEKIESGYNTVVFKILMRDGHWYKVTIDTKKSYKFFGYYQMDQKHLDFSSLRNIMADCGSVVNLTHMVSYKAEEVIENTHELVTTYIEKVWYSKRPWPMSDVENIEYEKRESIRKIKE